MTRRKLKDIVLFSVLGLFLFTAAMCGDSKDKPAENSTDTEKDTTAGILTVDEQRALRAEYGIDADKRITERNFDKEFESLKKEIEEDK